MLTNAAVKAARPKPRAFKLSDEGGLFMLVTPTGYRSFRMRYRDPVTRREQTLTIGAWPAISLEQARARRDEARAQLARGEDPRTSGAGAEVRTFEAVARAWHAHRAPGWSPVHAGDVLDSLAKDAFPAIGAMPLDAVRRVDVLQLLRTVEHRGAIETAKRLRQRLEAAFDFAIEEGWMTAANPAGGRRALAIAPAVRRQPALLDVDELVALLAAVEARDAAPILKLASRFLALTAVRLGTLRGARWAEIEDLDGRAPLWRIPAARMKLKLRDKADQANDHLVPLSAPAAAVLRAARALAWSTDMPAADVAGDALIFPGRRGGDAPIGEGAIGEMYARAGYAGRHVPHGWRASFSTVMNERRPQDRAGIDQALGHVAKGMSKVERAYNRAEHLELRASLFDHWGALLITHH